MARNVILLSPTDSDAATMTASSEVSGLPVANLQDMQPAKKWRSTGVATEYILVTFASAVAANAVALVGHNLSASGTIRIRGAVVQANLTSSPTVDTTAVSAWPGTGKPSIASWPHFTALYRWTNATACRYWRIDIADAAPATTYFEAGRLVLGAYWQPTINFDLGGTPLGLDPEDVQIKTPYGRTFTDRRHASAPRLFELSIYALTKSEALDGCAEIQRLRGNWGDVICCLDPDETSQLHRYTMQGVFTGYPGYTLPPAYDSSGNMFGCGIKLRELI